MIKKFLNILFFIYNFCACSFYCTNFEQQLLIANKAMFKNYIKYQKSSYNIMRLNYLYENQSTIFWHLFDPMIGLLDNKKKFDKLLSWNFSLLDLAPKKGGTVSIATIDQRWPEKESSKKQLCRFSKETAEVGDSLEFDLMVDRSGNLLLGETEKRSYLFSFLKNIKKSHGICTKNIILQIAPNASILDYNIFDENGCGSTQNLYEVIDKNINKNVDILHLGCKITSLKISQIDQNNFSNILKNINFIVASCGNDRIDNCEAYPAKFIDVAFDVGAFNYNHQICSFSQFEQNIGPKIVMPGQDIYCPVFFNDQEIGSVALSGTSVSASIMTGFLALVLAEFKNDFLYNQIVAVIYKSTYKLENNCDWNKKVLLGALDMRTALFCFNVLKKISNMINKKNFNRDFDAFVEQILRINQLYKDLYNKNSSLFYFLSYKSLEDITCIVSELALLTINNYRLKKPLFEKMFDKQLLCLLRINKIKKFEMNDRILYSLNRKS